MGNQIINQAADTSETILDAQKLALWRAIRKLKRLDREVKELEAVE